MAKKLLRVFLTFFILSFVFCSTVWAENVEDKSAVAALDHILLGNYNETPIDWIVLDNEQMNDGNPGFFLFSKYVVQESDIIYDDDCADWPGSAAQSSCTDFYNAAFSDIEKTVIPAVNVTEERSELFDLYWRPADLVDECLFYISAPELAKYYGPNDGADGLSATALNGHTVNYWLRSPHGYHGDYSGVVFRHGVVHDQLVYYSIGGRPATNMQLDNILYVTPLSTEEDDGSTLWKAAVIDNSIDFRITSFTSYENSLNISYQSDTFGAGWNIAVVIYDSDGKVSDNKILGDLTSASGTLDVDTKDMIVPDNGSISFYTLCTDDNQSIDIVSNPVGLRYEISFDVGEGTGTMDSVYILPGKSLELPEISFIAPEHQKFDHWEYDGKTVSSGDTISEDMKLSAVYSNILVDTIALDYESLKINFGSDTSVKATISPLDAADMSLVWNVDKSGVVKLVPDDDGSCAVSARRAGTVILTCASKDGGAADTMTVTVEASAFQSFFGNIEGVVTGVLLSALFISALLLIKKKKNKKLSILLLLFAILPLAISLFAFSFINIGNSSDEASVLEAVISTPEPTPFPEPQMEPGSMVYINGINPSQGSFIKDDILYVKLSDIAELLESELSYDAETGQYSMPWRLSEAVITPDAETIDYLGKSIVLETSSLLCDGGADVYMPIKSLCDALQIGLLEDEENNTLYCTPGAGDWELPEGYVVPVFMYHGTGHGDENANLIVEGSELEKQIQYLLENGYTPIWFEDLWNVENIEKPVIMTFDDGWANNYTTLYPLLQQYQIKATIFVVTSFLDVSHPHLSTAEVVEMSQSPYVSIQSHTVTHEQLNLMEEDEQAYEMEESRLQITRITGKEPCALSYPIGAATEETQKIALQYYRFATRMYSPIAYTTSDDPTWIYRLYVGRDTPFYQFTGELEHAIELANEKLQEEN